MSMAKQEYSATESVRKLLEDNSKALDVLDTLEEKNRQYQKSKRHTHIMYLVAAVNLFVSLYFAHVMYQSNCEIGKWIFLIVAIVGTACISGISQAKLEIDTANMMQSSEIKFINDLLTELVISEDFPFIKAGNHYYIDLPDGIREVSPENVPYDEDTKLIGREYRYKSLCWDRQGFSLQKITDVKICSTICGTGSA